MEKWYVVKITDFQHAVGRNGDAVPLPPEWYLSVGATVRVILGAAASLACFILLPALGSIFSQVGETPPLILAQRLLLGVAIAAASGFVAVGLAFLIAWCWWPWTRRSAGVRLEGEVQKLSLEELNEKIAGCEAGWREAPPKRKEGYQRCLVWLEGQRMRLHGVPAPVR